MHHKPGVPMCWRACSQQRDEPVPPQKPQSGWSKMPGLPIFFENRFKEGDQMHPSLPVSWPPYPRQEFPGLWVSLFDNRQTADSKACPASSAEPCWEMHPGSPTHPLNPFLFFWKSDLGLRSLDLKCAQFAGQRQKEKCLVIISTH